MKQILPRTLVAPPQHGVVDRVEERIVYRYHRSTKFKNSSIVSHLVGSTIIWLSLSYPVSAFRITTPAIPRLLYTTSSLRRINRTTPHFMTKSHPHISTEGDAHYHHHHPSTALSADEILFGAAAVDTTTTTTTTSSDQLEPHANDTSPGTPCSSFLPKSYSNPKKSMELIWCDATSVCMGEDNLREMVIHDDDDDDDNDDRSNHGDTDDENCGGGASTNKIVLRGPATGQVAYHWVEEPDETNDQMTSTRKVNQNDGFETPVVTTRTRRQCVLFLIKQGSDMDTLLRIAANAIQQLVTQHESLHILLDTDTAPRLQEILISSNDAVVAETGITMDDYLSKIHTLETSGTCRGFGENVAPIDIAATEFGGSTIFNSYLPTDGSVETNDEDLQPAKYAPNLIVTVGGDGLLMHAGMLFQGPMPPILCVAGGSLGFLTPFAPTEMVEAIEIALGLVTSASPIDNSSEIPKQSKGHSLQIFPPNMSGYDDDDVYLNGHKDSAQNKFTVGLGDCICLSIRMRLDCRIIDSEGQVKARYNVLNEVVIDRGSSPYLAALECFCDDVHLTTVQADGVIFATPTGSTAYSLAAGSSVVHPAVPCILVTPICPHVLSFRSMVFPDHVILRCYVPHDARAEASVAFDGKHRQELHRGDSVQIRLSAYPVPTINRQDHSADWLGSLKRNFNFNSRPRQRPL